MDHCMAREKLPSKGFLFLTLTLPPFSYYLPTYSVHSSLPSFQSKS